MSLLWPGHDIVNTFAPGRLAACARRAKPLIKGRIGAGRCLLQAGISPGPAGVAEWTPEAKIKWAKWATGSYAARKSRRRGTGVQLPSDLRHRMKLKEGDEFVAEICAV